MPCFTDNSVEQNDLTVWQATERPSAILWSAWFLLFRVEPTASGYYHFSTHWRGVPCGMALLDRLPT